MIGIAGLCLFVSLDDTFALLVQWLSTSAGIVEPLV